MAVTGRSSQKPAFHFPSWSQATPPLGVPLVTREEVPTPTESQKPPSHQANLTSKQKPKNKIHKQQSHLPLARSCTEMKNQENWGGWRISKWIRVSLPLFWPVLSVISHRFLELQRRGVSVQFKKAVEDNKEGHLLSHRREGRHEWGLRGRP